MEDIKITDSSQSHYTKDSIVFTPNVSRQRYTTVHELLVQDKWKNQINSVTEYGCASFKLFPYLKNSLDIKEINFIDIDSYLLEEKMNFLRPLLYDHLNKRINPLTVNVFEGSIADADARIFDSDAVIGIEIIEHLFPDTLEAVPYVIFHTIRPKIVIFTTPNADFNVAIPNFKEFRHPDHKFEWSREQFESWALNITLRFPQFRVSFYGIARGPDGTSSLGFCSQLALFLRKDVLDSSYETLILPCFCEKMTSTQSIESNYKHCLKCYPTQPFGICTHSAKSKRFECTKENDFFFYQLLQTVKYPHEDHKPKTKEEHIIESLKYKIYYDSLQYTNEDGVEEIPLFTINRSFEGKRLSEDEIKDVLLKHGYEIKNCLVKNCYGKGNHGWAPCVIYRRPDSPSNSSETSGEDEDQSSSSDQLNWDIE